MRPRHDWKNDPNRGQLLALYARADALVANASCACTVPASLLGEASPQGEPPTADEVAPCCHFAVTGREPYPTAVELEEVAHAIRVRGMRRRPTGRRLQLVDQLGRCPLLGDDVRCTIYGSRPLGCRTFFCDRGDGPPKAARAGLLEVARRIADLSAKAFPRDPLPRPLVAALKGMV